MRHCLSIIFAGLSFLASLPPPVQAGELLLHDTLRHIPLGLETPHISFSSRWEILGPFRLGTREAIWGADPLENQGGFHSLRYGTNATFNSALAANGTVKWEIINADTCQSSRSQAKVFLNVGFPEIDWNFLQSAYGWPALQYQSWARGLLEIKGVESQKVAISAGGLLEFRVDGDLHFGGDLYHYHRAPSVFKLSPGQHVVDLRLTRDVRALGGLANAVEVTIEAELREEPINLDKNSLLVSELTKGKLGGAWASINLQNNAAGSVEVMSIHAPKTQHRLSMRKTIQVRGHQTRPLIFNISLEAPITPRFSAEVVYRVAGDRERSFRTHCFEINLNERFLSDTQRITYLHPSNIVSYAILRPPPLDSCNPLRGTVPVILGLHGAGLEADSSQARSMLDAAYGVCAWMLFPSGVTSWSGDDWHIWGVSDVQAAVSAVSEWAANIGWEGPGATLHDLIISGHSNGGQGAWYFSTHYPDNVSAVAPVSAYTSIENYVPYTMWQDSEPLLSSVLLRSRSTYKHELLLSNLAGIPVAQQHGSDDDNVPPYHSRLMHELLGQTQWPSEYEELPSKGHWFEGVMTTAYLRNFYSAMANRSRTWKAGPHKFTITVPACGDMGSKAGIQVDQLQSPDMTGRLTITHHTDNGTWHISTQNIHRFHFSQGSFQMEMPVAVMLDDTDEPFEVNPAPTQPTWYLKDALGRWKVSHDTSWRALHQRYGRQLGAIDAVLRSRDTLTIMMCSPGVESTALQISRNFLQYFGADSQILGDCRDDDAQHESGNVIILAVDGDLPQARLDSFPIRNDRGHLVVLDKGLSPAPPTFGHEYVYEPGLGALFLRPLEDERLELVVWGADLAGLRQAARLVPTITGAGQPDYVILSDSCRWRGHAGVYAAGHFDRSWQISPGSYRSGNPILQETRG